MIPTSVPSLERGAGTSPALRFFVLALALTTLACTVEDRPLPDDEASPVGPTVQSVEAMLNESAASWNAGDLDGFVDDYSDDPRLAFVGATGVTRGIAEVRARYETGYWSEGAPPDSLRFEDLEVRPLGEGHALALGRYVLYRPTEDTITSTGWFSLVLGVEDGRWRILHDHTSELDPG